MDYFSYPIDTKMLLRKKNLIQKQLLEKSSDWIEKKIAVLGGSTTNEVVDQLNNFLLFHGIKAEFYQSEYGQYWQDAIFGSPELDSFNPDVIYIHTSWRNIQEFPKINTTKEETDKLFRQESSRFENMWENLNNKFQCPIIQNNFDRPNYRLMGNRDIWDYGGRSNFIFRMNQFVYEYAQKHKNFYVNDLEYISQDYGLSEWNNSLYWHMYKYAMCMDAIPYVSQSIANIIKSIYGKNKKVLAIDLDNTLWGGIIGDDGVEGIKIGLEASKGQVFSEFQQYCKKLKDIGVVLAIDSKNEVENAMAGLNHPDGILRPNDFVSIKANWNPKDQNLKEIADELTLGIDSFVFVDDNPAEREIVSTQFASVAVPVLDEPENYIKVLDHSGYFEVTSLSREDMDKTTMYCAKTEANKIMAAFANYGEYLNSLQMVAQISDFNPMNIQRVAQLTNKSNQFNLTTLRCTENDIQNMQNDPNYICLCGRLIDKFADNGIVTVVIGEQIECDLHIRMWLMSCRVLKRGLEDAVMNVLVEKAKLRGIRKIYGYYYPTAKNMMVKDFYFQYGFKQINETAWEIKIDDYNAQSINIKIVKEDNV